MPAQRACVQASQLSDLCEAARQHGGRLVALWGSDETPRGHGYGLHIALALPEGLLWLTLALNGERARYPGIANIFACAERMQRATFDLLGIAAEEHGASRRKWLRHGAWPQDVFPLRKDFAAESRYAQTEDRYPFVTVQGEGVHEIAVGPVHAGTIEPGHFRFSVVGEKVLRLEERLGYTHKGLEKRFEGMTLEEGARLAARVSGDSTVAYAWAYAMATETATQTEPPRRAVALRGIFLELERIANHLGDLGYLGNDVALSFGFAQFWRLKEDLLRLNAQLFGHRYLMDSIVPGGTARDVAREKGDTLIAFLGNLEREVGTLRSIYDEHAGAQDRFITTGQVPRELAERMGLTGFAGRASGVAHDLRVDYPVAPWQQLEPRMAMHTAGDVAARVAVRFDELSESMRLVRELLAQVPPGEIRVPLAACQTESSGIGWVEGWRGEVLVALDARRDGRIYRLHPHDPSWQNWPVLERAVLGNIVADFPLINKSFNLSYSGHDL